VIVAQLEKSPTTNAILRTTTAATILEGGVKDNVLPAHARAVINFRIKPGDNVGDVLAHVTKVVNDRRPQYNSLSLGQAKTPRLSQGSTPPDSRRSCGRFTR
jgi:carboxypeptidase PM20D1